jgi:hypothetical protein
MRMNISKSKFFAEQIEYLARHHAGKKPIDFYSRKLNTVQKRYTTTERELLSAIETCKKYKNILLDYPIIVFTDHKNNTFNGLRSALSFNS